MKKILTATDGSSGGDRAVDSAAELAHGLGAELIILTVAGELPTDEMRKLRHAEGDLGSALDSAAECIIASAAARAAEAAPATISRRVAWGDPASSILEEADRDAVDMIVIGRRGRGRLTGLLLGSVSQKLVSLAKCPVVVVP